MADAERCTNCRVTHLPEDCVIGKLKDENASLRAQLEAQAGRVEEATEAARGFLPFKCRHKKATDCGAICRVLRALGLDAGGKAALANPQGQEKEKPSKEGT